jgi:hypothetical protein
MENTDFVIYGEKTFGSLCQDIVKNSEDKKQQLDILTTDLRSMIKTIEDAVMIVPLLKEYYDVGVRNDEQRIKLAAIIQRLITGRVGADGGSDGAFLSDEEKKQLMASIEEATKAMSENVIVKEVPHAEKKKKA